ncbi:hypothetical protein DFP72DRAFT_1076297 [Ephemerocybe angulata]|uniref:Uncharacterized protein n=1 Tax=Ephemerocybe angulata TaxID=980116 RepID=A0A8H6LXI6_9AGAR|nr:hypothetical protein DFP72DRAFT_1076297 [Tulosesus angulatus]
MPLRYINRSSRRAKTNDQAASPKLPLHRTSWWRKARTQVPVPRASISRSTSLIWVAHTLDKYSGKDVRKAVYESHREAERLKDPMLSSVEKEKSPLKPFNNRPNAVPKGSSNPTPIPSMTSVSKHPARE